MGTNEYEMTKEDFKLLASNSSLEAYPKITLRDEFLLKEIKKRVHSIVDKTNPEEELLSIANSLLPDLSDENSRIVIANYLSYMNLTSFSIDILAYRLLFANKDTPRALSLYKRDLSKLEKIN